MIVLTEEQFSSICPKRYKLGQCEWFRTTYGKSLIIVLDKYYLEFETEKQETFFRLKYSNFIS